MAWWEHPEKGYGRYVKQDNLGRWQIRSPWYDHECEVRSPKEVAIELDMDHVGSGDTFFEGTIIEQHKKLFAKKPLKRLFIDFRRGVSDDSIPGVLVRWENSKVVSNPVSGGKWSIWCELRNGRPDQSKSYILGVDISKGQGASNSTVSIMCNETREKIAAFACANTPPHALARLVCAAAIWCGGRNKRPLVIWENNGDPGFDFGEQITRVYQYPNVYFDRQAGTLRQKAGKRWGWRSSPEKKAIGLGLLRRAYAHGRFINHDEVALDEALTYIHFEGGGIGPADLVDESDSARKAHGDRVIADMLCVVGLREAPKLRKGEYTGPQKSFGFRLAEFRKKRRQKDWTQRKRFNFAEAS
jgi:hypothetical protein